MGDIPFACTLTGSSFQERLADIAQLMRDGLRSFERSDLVINLVFIPAVASRVQDMVRKEQACCGFLSFEVIESPEEIRLTIIAPERARAAADDLFEQFLAGGTSSPASPAR